jgi:predicted dehydrogenase
VVVSLSEKYNVAIVGCGFIAQTHLYELKKLNGVKVVAVCDSDKKKAIATSKEWKINHYYTDFSKMLDNEDLSIISILTPPSSHAFLAIEAIKHGINVVVEKPLTMMTKEADSIINALRGSNAKMTVVYHWLFYKTMLESLSLIRKQEIGEVLSADMKMVHCLRFDPMASDPNHWSHKLLGGRFGELLPHPVYILQSLLGDKLDTKKVFVSKRGNVSWMPNDELHAILQGEKGLGSLYVSLNASRMSDTCDVYGTKKILRIDLIRQTMLQMGPMGYGRFSIGKDTLSESSKLSLSIIKNAFEYSFHKFGHHLSYFYRNFVDSIRNHREPLVTPEMAYNTVKTVEEICEGIEQTKEEGIQ